MGIATNHAGFHVIVIVVIHNNEVKILSLPLHLSQPYILSIVVTQVRLPGIGSAYLQRLYINIIILVLQIDCITGSKRFEIVLWLVVLCCISSSWLKNLDIHIVFQILYLL